MQAFSLTRNDNSLALEFEIRPLSVTLTPESTASWRIEGIAWPEVQSPTTMRYLICSIICRYIGLLSD
jgi:hypothetical protein